MWGRFPTCLAAFAAAWKLAPHSRSFGREMNQLTIAVRMLKLKEPPEDSFESLRCSFLPWPTLRKDLLRRETARTILSFESSKLMGPRRLIRLNPYPARGVHSAATCRPPFLLSKGTRLPCRGRHGRCQPPCPSPGGCRICHDTRPARPRRLQWRNSNPSIGKRFWQTFARAVCLKNGKSRQLPTSFPKTPKANMSPGRS